MNRMVVYSFVFLLFGSIVSAQVPAAYPGASAQTPFPQQFPAQPQSHQSPYYQPVKIQGPQGSKIAFAAEGQFVERQNTPYAVGLRVGADYRLRITNIPFEPGREVFPSVKVIDRTYPPQGRALEYPILIEITQEDIELALNGKLVTRVIYLENPDSALPIRSDLGSQLTTDIKTGNPITHAATLGQPVAVLYLGGRIPNSTQNIDAAFFHGSPPWAEIVPTPSGRFEVSFFGTRNPAQNPSLRPVLPQPASYQTGSNRHSPNF